MPCCGQISTPAAAPPARARRARTVRVSVTDAAEEAAARAQHEGMFVRRIVNGPGSILLVFTA